MQDSRYEIHAVTRADEPGLRELARFLNSINLPDDPVAIGALVETSEASFSGAIGDPRRRRYVFVVHDLEQDRAVGTSMVIAQLGRRDAPYIYFDVSTEERYSASLDRHFIHRVLSIGYSYRGPTEIGGLVMHPDYRRAPEKLGMLISYIRFLWIATHRDEFQDQVLAELMPPLEPDGTSQLWEAVGRHFTNMSYQEADRLSERNKEFIRGLFPDGEIYASVLPRAAQEIIGKVGPQTKGVEKMLKRIGFRYADRVDPFDGGPHFVADTDEILLVQRTRNLTIACAEDAEDASDDTTSNDRPVERVLVACEFEGPPYFRALAVQARIDGGGCTIERRAMERLGLAPGDTAAVLPLG